MLARRFLYVIAGLIFLVLIAGIGWTLFQDKLFRLAFVSSEPFDAGKAGPAPDYGQAAAWLSRPGLPNDPSHWRPAGETAPTAPPQVAVFYVPPTTYYAKTSWNAPISDVDSHKWAGVFAASEASAFNRIGAIWAPRYRSAALGAFLSPGTDATKALNLAHGDVLRAFDSFVAQIPASQPIILAGHSQSSLHMMRLMRERVANKPIADRIVAAYLVGWPISVEADVPALGLPACTAAGQTRCLLSWQSFAEPADPKLITSIYEQSAGLTGKPRKGTAMLCVNPLTGAPATAALPAANRGTLLPGADLADTEFQLGLIPARCDASGVLLIGPPPEGLRQLRHAWQQLPCVRLCSVLGQHSRRRGSAHQSVPQQVICTSTLDFRTALPDRGRLAGLDVGTKTIGVALCDSGWTIASPAETLARIKFSVDAAKLRALLTGQSATGMVIGLPLNLDGTDSPRTQSVRAFARNVEAIGLPILLWDERWSTQAVTRTLIDADASRARRAELVDKLAAAYILQGAIDAMI